MLDRLSERKAANDTLRNRLNAVSSIDEETVEVVRRIIRKDLRCGVGVKTALKVFDGIPLHEVMLCNDDLDKFEKEIDWDWDRACWSVKKDGVRVWAHCYLEEEAVVWLSRNGREYHNFHSMDNECLQIAESLTNSGLQSDPIVLDGEVVSKEGDFQDQMTQVRRENGDTEFYKFVVFDYVVFNIPFEDRYDALENSFSNTFELHYLKLLEHLTVHRKDRVTQLLDMMIGIGEEGLVLKDWESVYEKKRTNTWCKVKKFYTIDMDVIEVLPGTGKYADVMGALRCTSDQKIAIGKYTYEGAAVKIGSGYSDDQRKEFLNNPPSVIEIKFQNVTKDGSLRFPIFVRPRPDKDSSA